MGRINLEYHDDVAVARLEHGKTNPINLELLNELSELLVRVNNDPTSHALVLASASPKFFSIGFELPVLMKLAKEEFHFFIWLFDRICLDLYTFPKPTLAALTGHATGGGCILALGCDYRFLECWYSAAAQQRMREALEKF